MPIMGEPSRGAGWRLAAPGTEKHCARASVAGSAGTSFSLRQSAVASEIQPFRPSTLQIRFRGAPDGFHRHPFSPRELTHAQFSFVLIHGLGNFAERTACEPLSIPPDSP